MAGIIFFLGRTSSSTKNMSFCLLLKGAVSFYFVCDWLVFLVVHSSFSNHQTTYNLKALSCYCQFFSLCPAFKDHCVIYSICIVIEVFLSFMKLSTFLILFNLRLISSLFLKHSALLYLYLRPKTAKLLTISVLFLHFHFVLNSITWMTFVLNLGYKIMVWCVHVTHPYFYVAVWILYLFLKK